MNPLLILRVEFPSLRSTFRHKIKRIVSGARNKAPNQTFHRHGRQKIQMLQADNLA